MTLAQYLRREKLILKDFAKRAGLSVSVVSKVARGLVTPKLDTAKKIRRASAGKVDLLK